MTLQTHPPFFRLVFFIPCLVGLLLTPQSARAADPSARIARALSGPEPDAVYVELTAGDPSTVTPPRSYVHRWQGEALVRMSGFLLDDSPGNPAIPYRTFRLALPPDADPASLQLELVHLEEMPYPQALRIAPAPPPLYDQTPPPQPPAQVERPSEAQLRWELQKWGVGKRIADGHNVRIYERDALYPAQYAEVAAGGRLRKWQAATLRFTPLRFNPVTGDAVLARRVVAKVGFQRQPGLLQQPEMQRLLRDESFDAEAAKIFLNYQRARAWYHPLAQPQEEAPDAPPPDPDYALVTTDATFTTSTRLADFCFHKQDLGHSVMVVTEHETHTVTGPSDAYFFTTAAGGYEDVVGDDPPHQRPEKIRKWLQDNYLVLGIRHVLLVGDPDPDNAESDDHVGDLPMVVAWRSPSFEHPTDLYYSDLTGDWNHDDDEYVGEYVAFTGLDTLPAGVTGATFSVRWEGVVEIAGAPAEDWFLFYGTTDGLTDVWLDTGNDGFDAADLLLSDADEHQPLYNSHWFQLADGVYPLRIEYRQTDNHAYLDLRFRTFSAVATLELKHEVAPEVYEPDLAATYFNNDTWTLPVVASPFEPYPHVEYVPSGDRGAGGVDFLPEVWIGRIPFYDEDATDGDELPDVGILDAILDKIIAYETADGAGETWRRRILCTTPWMYDHDADPGYETADYEGCETLRSEVAPPPFWSWHRIHDEDYGVTAEAIGCSPDATVAGWNDPLDADDGRGVVMWRTHGWQTGASEVFTEDRCPDLDDSKPSIVLQLTCGNGWPEVEPGPSYPLGYSLLKQGAIATISASRASAGGVFDPLSADIARKNNPYLLFYLGKGVLENVPLGEVLAEVRSYDAILGWNWGNIFNYNLYGDPTLSLFGTGLKTNTDVVFVLDGSGSMLLEGKWDAAKDATVLFYDLQKELRHPLFHDRYSGVVFRWSGGVDDSVALPPGGLREMTEPLTVSSFDPYTPVGSYLTPIGHGLELGVSELDLASPESFYSDKYLVLLSDGKHNRGIDPLDVDIPEGVQVHAVGLGDDSIEPATIENIALGSGGQFRISPSPRETEEFFLQILAETSWKLQTVPVTGTEVPIDQDRAVFIAVWDDPAVSVSFDLDPPGAGPNLTPTALDGYPPMVCSHDAPDPGETHAFYSCTDVPDDLLGTWEFVNLHDEDGPVDLADLLLTVVEDPRVIAGFAIDDAEHATGDPLVLTARITEDERPLTGLTEVTAELIRAPDLAVGTAMAQNEPPPGYPSDPPPGADRTLWSHYLLGVLETLQLDGVPQTGGPTIRLRDDGTGLDAEEGDGIYTGVFRDTRNEGSYTFRFVGRGVDGAGVTFARTATLSTFVRFAPSPQASEVTIVSVTGRPDSDQLSAVVRVTPRDRFGAYLGPLRDEQIDAWTTEGRVLPDLADRRDGSYELTLVYPRGSSPQLTVVVGNTIVTAGQRVRKGRYGLSAHLGSAQPSGTFSSAYDAGPSVMLDLELPLRPRLSAVALLGYSAFEGVAGVPDTYWVHGSGNLKYELTTLPVAVWIAAGLGAYLPKNGSTRPGANLTVGFDRMLTSDLDFEAAVDYHHIFTSGSDTELYLTRVGIVWRF